ncbi:hypothetical protein HRR78_007703 [Exophiala dermatitidis]|nr:hypothetical protein HRR75_007318 [Exophiala dermatitidis]KAJ4539656.1 hypothetical protein HRR78_007703 [Exophiala dermatitidis]
MDSPSSDELSILYYHEDMRQFSVAPGITAHINNMDDHALAVSYTMLELKVQLICRKMAMPSEADRRLGLDTQMCLKLANIAPVLSALALLDMGRLDSHTAVDVIKVAKIKSSYTPGETATSDVLPMASIVTDRDLLQVDFNSIKNGGRVSVSEFSPATAAMYFLCLFLLEQYRFLDVHEVYHFAQEEGILGICRLRPFARAQCDSTSASAREVEGHDCAICQIDRIGDAEWIYDLPCRHQFHKGCLVKWLIELEQPGCPLCRDVIAQEMLDKLSL